MPSTEQAILVELVRINKAVSHLKQEIDGLRSDERKRFDDLIKTTLKMSVEQRYPLRQVNSTQDVANHLVGLGMFDEVPLGDETGYNQAELGFDLGYTETSDASK